MDREPAVAMVVVGLLTALTLAVIGGASDISTGTTSTASGIPAQ